MSAQGATEFTVPDPLDDDVVWRVRYYHHNYRNWWMRMKRNAHGAFIPTGGFVPAADDPMQPDHEHGDL